jgi:2,4-diketo-3-deoxy-L-fuconate hydrolase
MKLIRYGPPGEERPGALLDDGQILDVRAMAFDISDYDAHFFETFGIERVKNLARESGRRCISAEGLRWGPPIARPSKIICLGKNYADHAREFDAEIPAKPVLFGKAPSAITGPYDPVCLPQGADTCDIEVELAVVIGRRMRRVSEADALSYVAGYMILDDVTDRAAQREGKQWFRGKSADTFCPMGPWLVTTDEVGDPQNLRLRSKVNGKVLQDATTADMIFPIARVLAFISATITLEAGDVVATGTPGGIGSARTPPVLLRPGDVIELEIDGLGSQRNVVQASV